MEVIYKHIGIVLRLTREAAELSQVQIAKRSGYTQSVIARWEAGKSRIQIHDLIALAAAYNTTAAKLWRKCESILDHTERTIDGK